MGRKPQYNQVRVTLTPAPPLPKTWTTPTYHLERYTIRRNVKTVNVQLLGLRGNEKRTESISFPLLPNVTDEELVRAAVFCSPHKWTVHFGMNLKQFNGQFASPLNQQLLAALMGRPQAAPQSVYPQTQPSPYAAPTVTNISVSQPQYHPPLPQPGQFQQAANTNNSQPSPTNNRRNIWQWYKTRTSGIKVSLGCGALIAVVLLFTCIGSAIGSSNLALTPTPTPTSGQAALIISPTATHILTPVPTHKPTPTPKPTQQHAASTSTHVAVGISPGSGYETPFGNMSSSQQQAVINQMKSDGVQWLRLDYSPNTSYDYQFIKLAKAAGIDVDVLLEDFSATPTQFAAFGTQAVTTLKPLGVHTYEILNEVNTYNSSSITADQYISILKSVYPAIKTADPFATVLMSGLDMSGNPNGYLQAMYNAGGKGYFDAVNAHPYTFYPAMPALANCPSSNTFCSGLPALYAIMQQNGDGNKKIWITEFGCPTGTHAGQPAACTDATLAQQITQAYNQANAWGWIGSLFIFSWQDNTGDGDFGLYYANGSPKTVALAAFKQAAFHRK